MNVVGHHHPIIQQILLAVKMLNRPGNHVRDFGPPQMTFADALIEVPLHLAAQFAMDFFGLPGGCVGRESAQSPGMFTLEARSTAFGNESTSRKVTK